jgi:hypothetical protein
MNIPEQILWLNSTTAFFVFILNGMMLAACIILSNGTNMFAISWLESVLGGEEKESSLKEPMVLVAVFVSG